MPTLLFLSLVAASFSCIALLVGVPAIVAAEIFISGKPEVFAQLTSNGEARQAFGFVCVLTAWLLVYWRALRRARSWFRPFVLVSLTVLYVALVAAGSAQAISFPQLAGAFVLLVLVPAWYLYRKSNVAAFFSGRRGAGRSAAA